MSQTSLFAYTGILVWHFLDPKDQWSYLYRWCEGVSLSLAYNERLIQLQSNHCERKTTEK